MAGQLLLTESNVTVGTGRGRVSEGVERVVSNSKGFVVGPEVNGSLGSELERAGEGMIPPGRRVSEGRGGMGMEMEARVRRDRGLLRVVLAELGDETWAELADPGSSEMRKELKEEVIDLSKWVWLPSLE